MKRIFTILFLVCVTSLAQAQSPAGDAFYIDYDQFNIDNLRRYLTCGNDASLNTTNEVTMEAWVRIHDSNWNQKIFGKLNPNFNSGYMIAVDQGKCYAEVWTPANNDELHGFVPPLGYWYHFAATAKAGDSLNIYVNGKFVGGGPIGGTSIASNTSDLAIGIAPWDLQSFQYFGHIDEVRIWSVARTGQEIWDNVYIPLDGTEPNLMAYYDFDGASVGTPVSDKSQNSNDCSFFNCDPSNVTPSNAVLGDATMKTMTDLNGLWNGNGFTNPRVSLTDNGLSLVDTLMDWDYVVFGHDNGMGTSQADLPGNAPASMERTGRVWYMNEVGSTSPNFSWNLNNAAGGGTALSSALSANNFYLLYRAGNSGDFTILSAADVKNGTTVIFNNVAQESGYYALAASPDPLSISNGLSSSRFLTVYPNPSQGVFKLVVDTQLAGDAHVQVFDVLGKRVHAESFNHDISFQAQALDLSELVPGTYFLHVRSGEEVFVKEVLITEQN